MARLFTSLLAQKPKNGAGGRFIISLMLGGCAAFSFQPFGFFPFLWISFFVFYALLQKASTAREAFFLGWGFAMGCLVVCLHWIAAALFVDIQAFWWAVVPAVLGLPAFFSLYYGMAALLAWRSGLRHASGPFVFAGFWFLAELARGRLLTGFPWDLWGSVWANNLPLLQSASLIGIEGLTLITLCLALLPSAFLTTMRRKHAFFLCLGGVIAFAMMVVGGEMRLAAAGPTVFDPSVRLRLIQPNIPQALKWHPERRLANLQGLLRLSFETEAQKPITHFLWPETAIAYYLAEDSPMRQRIAGAMPQKTMLLTGVVRRTVEPDENTKLFYNSIIAMDHHGTIIGGYNKAHLVPFGEYMPLRSLIPSFIETATGSDFTAGPGPRTLRALGLPPFAPLICYEAIFSDAGVERGDPPKLLINLTNDAWYAGTIGPAQHFMMARLRALEEGLPLVRVANGGWTGVVDAYGRITALTIGNHAEALDADLPLGTTQPTLFIRGGRYTSIGFSALFIALLITGGFLRKQQTLS